MLAAGIAISAATLLFSVIVLCFGRKAAKLDAVHSRLTELGREVTGAYVIRDEELDKPFADRVIRPAVQRISQALAVLVPVRSRNSGERQKKMLQQAKRLIICQISSYSILPSSGSIRIMLIC